MTGVDREPYRPNDLRHHGPLLHGQHTGGDGPDLEVFLRCVFQYLVVKRQISDGPFEPAVPSLELFEAFRLVDPKASVLVASPIESLLSDSELTDCFNHRAAGGHGYPGLVQLGDDLLWRMLLPWHFAPSLACPSLTFDLDQFSVGKSQPPLMTFTPLPPLTPQPTYTPLATHIPLATYTPRASVPNPDAIADIHSPGDLYAAANIHALPISDPNGHSDPDAHSHFHSCPGRRYV